MRRLLFLMVLLPVLVLAGQRVQILVCIDRHEANADSVAAAAVAIDSAMGEIWNENSRYLVIGRMAESLADTLPFAPLDSLPGVEVLWSADSLPD